MQACYFPQRNITSIEQFVSMKSSDRRALVRSLTDEEYHDILAMCSMLPHINIKAETQGQLDGAVYLVWVGVRSCNMRYKLSVHNAKLLYTIMTEIKTRNLQVE